jgi:hypothetical protein
MFISPLSLPADKDLWLRLEIRAGDPLQSPITEAGLSLTSLIELFNRPPQSQEWNAETPSFRLGNLKR